MKNKLISLLISALLVVAFNMNAQTQYDLIQTSDGALTSLGPVTGYEGFYATSNDTLYTTLQNDGTALDLVMFFDYSRDRDRGVAAKFNISLDGLSDPEYLIGDTWFTDQLESSSEGEIQLKSYHHRFELADYFALENMEQESINWKIDIKLKCYDSDFVNSWKYLNADGSTIDLKLEKGSIVTLSGLSTVSTVPEPATIGLISCLGLILFVRTRKNK